MTATNPLESLYSAAAGAADTNLAGALATLAVRGAGIGTWLLDLDTGAAWWDEQMWALRGLAPLPQAPGVEQQLALVHPDDRDAIRAAMAQAIRGDGIAQYEFRVVHADGTVRWLASRSSTLRGEDGRARRRLGVNWDVTDARSAERIRQDHELARREARARAALFARISHELRTPLNAVLGLAELLLDDPADDAAAAARRHEQLLGIRDAGRRLLLLVDDVLALSRLPPEAGPAPSGPRPMPAADATGSAAAHTLLYIEDNPVNALIVAELARRRPDLRLHLASSGHEGVQRAAELSPRLVLLDMQLPDIDGFEVLARLREMPQLAHSPVIALSANAMPADIQRAMDAGLTAYWTKPLDFKVFNAAIDDLFGPAPLPAG